MATEQQGFANVNMSSWRERVILEKAASERAKTFVWEEPQRDASPELKVAGTKYDETTDERSQLQQRIIAHQLSNKFYNKRSPSLP